MELIEIKNLLRNFQKNHGVPERKLIGNELEHHKQVSVLKNAQEEAKELWCLEQIERMQSLYLTAFEQLKRQQYYKMWCTLEIIENTSGYLHKHFKGNAKKYWITFIDETVAKFQSLFPYHIFASPELVVRHECSICSAPLGIRNSCNHEEGEIYNGELCLKIVHIEKCLGTALVENPVQKYSVIFLSDPSTGESIDQYNYCVLDYLRQRLAEPFQDWEFETSLINETRPEYRGVERNDLCPCKSGQKFKRCHLSASEGIRKHYTFHLGTQAATMKKCKTCSRDALSQC